MGSSHLLSHATVLTFFMVGVDSPLLQPPEQTQSEGINTRQTKLEIKSIIENEGDWLKGYRCVRVSIQEIESTAAKEA